jgi:hypothetical protein
VAVITDPVTASAVCARGDGRVRVLTLATFSLLALVGMDVPRPLEVAATNAPLAAWRVLLRAARA